MALNSHDLLYVTLKIYCKRFSLNLKGLFDGKVESLTKKEYDSAVYFFTSFNKIFKVNI